MDALRDHRRSDLRHDRDDHRVRCSVNRRDHHVMVGHHVNRRSDLQDVDHRLLLDDRHRMGYLCVDDLKLGVSLVVNRGHHMNDRLGGHSMGVDRHDVLGDLRTNVTDDRNDLMMVVNHVNRNCVLLDRNLDVTKVGNRDHRKNGMDDRNDLMMVVNLYRHTNDPLDDHLMDDGHRDVLVGHRANVMDDLNLVVNRVNRNYVRRDQNLDASRANRNCDPHDLMTDVNLDDRKMGVKMDGNLYRHTNVTDDRNDLKMGGTTDVSRGHRMSDRLDDQNLDVSRVNRRTGVHLNAQLVYEHRVDLTIDPECYVRHDLMTDGNLDVSLCHRMNDLLDDRNLDDDLHDQNLVVNRVNRNCVLLDLMKDGNLDVSRVNRNYALRDRKMDVNLDAMSHRVKLTGDRSTSCDRMSRDHLQCDHQMMRHRDTNRMDVKNLDAMKMMNHRVNRRMMDDLKMVCLMKI